MPVFDFIHEATGETISVLVRHTEPDIARHEQVVGDKIYKRVYAAPLAASNSRPNDGTQQDFDRLVTDKKMTVGDAWKVSAELSERRAAQHGGVDPVKEQFYKDYKKKTGGEHADVKKRKAVAQTQKILDDLGIKLAT